MFGTDCDGLMQSWYCEHALDAPAALVCDKVALPRAGAAQRSEAKKMYVMLPE